MGGKGLLSMYNLTKNKVSVNLIFKVLFFLLLTSLYLQKFNIDIGFSLKPFMIVLSIIVFIFMLFKIKIINKCFIYEYFFLTFFVFSVIRGYFSYYKIVYFRLFLGFIIVFLLYVFSSSIIYKLKIRIIFRLIIQSSMVFLFLSLSLYIFGNRFNHFGAELDRGMYRLTGTVVDPNIFVIFLSIILGVSFHYSIEGKKKYYIPLIISLISLLLTFSRGGILGIIFFLIIYYIRYQKLKVNMIFKVLSLIIILFILVGVFNTYTDMDLASIINNRISDLSGSGRLKTWTNAINLIKMKPIFGIGLYNFLPYNIRLFNDYHYAHNTYLEIITENGIIGALFFIGFLFFFIMNRPKNKYAYLIKLIIYSQLFMLFFLSGIINEFVYFSFALYKGLNMKKTFDN